MGRLRSRFIIVPLLIALIVTGAVYFYLGRLGTTGGSQSSVQVVIASKPVAAHTVLTVDHLATKDIPRSFLLPNAMTRIDQVVGQVVNTPLAQGEMLVQGKISSQGTAKDGLAYSIPAGMRAVTVAVSETVAVAGFPRPGDTVDVYGTTDDPTGVTRLALENIPVLAIANKTEIETAPDIKSLTSMTLCVTPDQATILVYLTDFGRIRLALRPAGEASRGVASSVSQDTLPRGPAAGQSIVMNVAQKFTVDIAAVKRDALSSVGILQRDSLAFSELSPAAYERLQTLITDKQVQILKSTDLTVSVGSPAKFSAVNFSPVPATIGGSKVKSWLEYGLRLALDMTATTKDCFDLVTRPEIRIISVPTDTTGGTASPETTFRGKDGTVCIDRGGAAAITGLITAGDFTLSSNISKKLLLPDALVSDDLKSGAAELVIFIRPGN